MNHTISRNSDSTCSSNSSIIQGLQGGSEAPKQNINVSEDDVLIERYVNALFREGIGGDPSNRTTLQPIKRGHGPAAELPLPAAHQQKFGQLGDEMVRPFPVVRPGHRLLIFVVGDVL
jgi:hypothetical protein